MTKAKVLVTGGAGFVGKHLASELVRRNYEVTIYDVEPSSIDQSCRIRYQRGNLMDMQKLRQAVDGQNIVYHLGGLLGTTELNFLPQDAIDVNILGTLNVLEACRELQVPRVFYPSKPNGWLNVYSITKRAAEDLVRLYREVWGMDNRVLRWLNVYGPGQKTHPILKAVPTMILQALNDLPIEIYGSGNQPVDLIYVTDLVRIAIDYTNIDDQSAPIRDAGRTLRFTVNEMALTIKDLTGSKSSILHCPMRVGETEDIIVEPLSTGTAADLVGAPEPTEFEVGLSRTIDYYASLSRAEIREIADYYGWVLDH